MKIKLTKEQIEQLAQDPNTKVSVQDPWWVIVLKVTAYVIGLILAGMATEASANACVGFILGI